MKLSYLHRFNHIVIQIHDNPDADAVGSGYAIYRYLRSLGKDVRLVYGGREPIRKSNMRLMITELEIPLEYVRELDNPELLLTVDCQYGEGNVQRFSAQNVAMIDHHKTGRTSDETAEIRDNIVSCATVCYSMLLDAQFDVNKDVKIATALYYGLYMDSSRLSEIRHPLDRDMIDYLKYDKALITRLKYANFSISELETAGAAISHNHYIEQYRAAIVRSDPCDPNILGVIGDFVIQVDSIDICVIYNECAGGYKLSVRSCSVEAAANEVVSFLTAETGNGGGHRDKAGGFINGAELESKSGTAIEDYLAERLSEYFSGYDVVRFTEGITQPEKLRRFCKKPGVFGYVRSADIAPAGTELRIRTLEGDVLISSRDDIYIMIGSRGEVYPVESSVFESKYTPLDLPYTRRFEYAPSVIDTAAEKPCELLSFAKQCRSESGAIILAEPLEKYTKVFCAWNYDGYMAGFPGDMLCCSEDDTHDVYVVKRDIFGTLYDEIQ